MERKTQSKEQANKTWQDILTNNGFTEYIGTFEKNNIDSINTILKLSDHDLEKMGMENIGDRKKFIKLFKDARKKTVISRVLVALAIVIVVIAAGRPIVETIKDNAKFNRLQRENQRLMREIEETFERTKR